MEILRRLKRPALYLIVNFAVLCTLLVTIELAGQIAYYLKSGRFVYQLSGFQSGHVFERHPFLVARPKKNTSVTNQWGDKSITITGRNTRWTGAPEDDRGIIRVAVLGGSSTFGSGVTDADTWPALLQEKLGEGYSVINYGVPNFTTAEAIIQMSLIVPEEKPDFVVLYQGWDDMFRYHTGDGPDYYDHGMNMYDMLVVPMDNDQTLMDKLLDVSSIARLAAKIKRTFVSDGGSEPCKTYDTHDPEVDRIYVRNLNTLRVLTGRAADHTLFVPQVLNYDEFMSSEDTEGCNWVAGGHVRSSAMPRLMDRFNLLMRDVCTAGDDGCVYVDEVPAVGWEPDDFVDFGHFSRKGGEKFADVLNGVIKSISESERTVENPYGMKR